MQLKCIRSTNPVWSPSRRKFEAGGFGKDNEEGITRSFNLFAFLKLTKNFPNYGMMPLDRRNGFPLSKRPL